MASVRIDRNAPILIAESSPIHLTSLKEHLSDFHIENLEVAKDGYELLSATGENTYALILIGDPLLKGSSVRSIARIRAEGENKETPVIFLYDESMEEREKKDLIHDAIAEGVAKTVAKPIERATLRKSIEDALQKVIVTSEELKSRSQSSLMATDKAIQLANQLRDSGDFKQAEDTYVEAILNVFYGLAEMHLFNNDKASSDNILHEASFIDPDAPSKFLNRSKNFIEHGFQNLKIKNYQLAKSDFEAARSLDGENVMAHMGLGEALLGIDQKDEALESFKKALDLEAKIDHRTIYKRMATLTFRLKEYETAERAYEIAVSFIQSDPEIFYFQSLVYVALRKLPEALQSITNTLKLEPDYPGAKNTRQKILDWMKAAKEDETQEKEPVEAT